MSKSDFNFNYQEFMKNEFPQSKEELPSELKLIEHFDRITSLLFDSANNLLKQQKESGKVLSALFENTRHTIVANYRIRSINLIRTLNEVLNIDGKGLFDEGTVNIITRSLLESYLIYFFLYRESEKQPEERELKFMLYELSSILHFQKYSNSFLKKNSNNASNMPNFENDINSLILKIEKNTHLQNQTKRIIHSINKIKQKKQNYLSFINFTSLIKSSPLPTNFAQEYYSYASSFAHSEGFSLTMSQMTHKNVEKWNKLNRLMKFKALSICLYISSQFLISFIENEKIEFEDDRGKTMSEVFSLSSYYVKAMNYKN